MELISFVPKGCYNILMFVIVIDWSLTIRKSGGMGIIHVYLLRIIARILLVALVKKKQNKFINKNKYYLNNLI